MPRARIAWGLLVTLALTAAGCGGSPRGSQQPPASVRRVRVVATIYPLAHFARQVGQDRVEVFTLVPAGVEPHDWEPTPKDLDIVLRADLLVYNGAGMEPWISRLLASLGPEGPVTVEASRGVALITPPGWSSPDPHIWLDPVRARQMVENIRLGLSRVDAGGAELYARGAAGLAQRLEDLHRSYTVSLAGAPRKVLITSHAAFAYLADRYGLLEVPVSGLSPHDEPTPGQLARTVRLARKHGAAYVLFETLASPRVAEVIAREVGARTLTLNPVEGLTPEEESRGEDYFSLMEKNLEVLKLVLGVTK